MRKLNRKGFTLVELLAVIVILAIVVGIALTTVLPTLKQSRQRAFDLTADTAGDYLEKQYQLTLIGDVSGSTLDSGFTNGVPSTATDITEDQIKAAGLKAKNYVLANGDNNKGLTTWYIDSATGRACVKLTAATRANSGDNAGEYYDVEKNVATSNGCPDAPASSSGE